MNNLPGKTRFHSRPSNISKASTGSGSKRNATNITLGSGQIGGVTSSKAGSVAQVIFQGKIVTPQSLLTKKSASSKPTKKKPDFNAVPTIDEVGDLPEKPNQGNAGAKIKGRRNSSVSSHHTNKPAPDSFLGSSTVQKEDENFIIQLSETDTSILFSLTSFVWYSDTREIKEVEERNSRYEAIVSAHKNTDNYASHPTQTMNNPLKDQGEMIAPNVSQDFGCQANAYDINDGIREVVDTSAPRSARGTGADPHDDSNTGLPPAVRKFVKDTIDVALVTPGVLLDTTDLRRPKAPTEGGKESKIREIGGKRVKGSQSRLQTGDSEAISVPVSTDRNVPVSTADASSDGRSSGYTDDQKGGGQSSDSGSQVEPTTQSESFTEKDSQQILRERQAEVILSQPVLLRRLQLLERAIQQNAYHRKHLDYRDLPDIAPLSFTAKDKAENQEGLFGGFAGLGLRRVLGATFSGTGGTDEDSVKEGDDPTAAVDSSAPAAPTEGSKDVKLLFRFCNSDLVQGRSVTAMAWNAVNTDLLAVGYGKLDNFVETTKIGEEVNEELAGGLVLFWSLRNPDYPEKILRTSHPVTALEFSKLSPMMLAVGLLNGDVSVYDVKREFNWTKPVESSANIHGGHADPVWQVKWVVKGIERFESLISISTDGLVLEWNLKKGLVVTTLMQLKRSGSVEGWISRTAAGLCFDFVPSDPNTYVVGTEEGAMHRCSVSYNEQYLDSYSGHEGPVYRVRFSTRWTQLFISASADCLIQLYHSSIKTPLLKMRATGEEFAINDICWCPGNSTIFAAVTANAKLQIWDLSSSSIDPVALVDTNIDEETALRLLAAKTDRPDLVDGVDKPASPTSPAPISRYDRLFDQQKEEAKELAVAKLLKNLTATRAKRELTCVQFGERSPTLAVGDNYGTVMIYRVLAPQTITHEGPLQQMLKLKNTVRKQVDPVTAARLAALEVSKQVVSTGSASQSLTGDDPTGPGQDSPPPAQLQ